MRDPAYQAEIEMAPAGRSGTVHPPDVTAEASAFTALIRTRAFTFLRAWSIGDDETALGSLDAVFDGGGVPWTGDRLADAREGFCEMRHGGGLGR